MNTKFDVKVGAIEMDINGQIIKTPEISGMAELDASISELKGLYDLKKQMLEEAPELIEKFTTKLVEVLMTTYKNFENADDEIKRSKDTLTEEYNINEWFREYFLAPDVTEEAKNQFSNHFNGRDWGKTKASDAKRVDFFEMPFDTKRDFFKKICDTCF